MKRLLTPGFAAGLATILALAPHPAPGQTPPAVGVVTAALQPVYNQTSYVGRIQSPQIVQISARVTGYLEQQDFKDGDTVHQGQLLYMIEQPPYQAAVAQAEAAVQQAKAQAHNADLTLARARALLPTPAGQQSSVDTAAATAQSDAGGIDGATAQLQTAEINLGYTEIRAPIDGRIGATLVTTGNVVGPATGTLATIVSEDPVYVTFALPVLDAIKLRTGDVAEGGFSAVDIIIKLPDGRLYSHTGRIDFVDNQITQATDTLNLRATVANPIIPGINQPQMANRELQDGEFVTVTLRDRTAQQQIALPRGAVITDQLGDYVLLVDRTNTVRRQNVTMGQETAGTVIITKGLRPGDEVVTEGIQRIHAGLTVKPQPATGSGAD